MDHIFIISFFPRHTVAWIHADFNVFIFPHFHTALRTEENMLDINWLQAAKELVKLIIISLS